MVNYSDEEQIIQLIDVSFENKIELNGQEQLEVIVIIQLIVILMQID